MTKRKKHKRIGIYAGAFDPVHSGHIAFALQALAAAQLDKVYFMPERQPRGKAGVEHFGHRIVMLKRALWLHPKCDVIEMVDANLSVARTLPKLQQQFGGAQLVFLFGSDVVPSLPSWPNVAQLLSASELVVGLRRSVDEAAVRAAIAGWPVPPRDLAIFDSYAPDVSSGHIRQALYRRRHAHGLLPSVARYSDHHWLYVSLA